MNFFAILGCDTHLRMNCTEMDQDSLHMKFLALNIGAWIIAV